MTPRTDQAHATPVADPIATLLADARDKGASPRTLGWLEKILRHGERAHQAGGAPSGDQAEAAVRKT